MQMSVKGRAPGIASSIPPSLCFCSKGTIRLAADSKESSLLYDKVMGEPFAYILNGKRFSLADDEPLQKKTESGSPKKKFCYTPPEQHKEPNWPAPGRDWHQVQ